MLIYLAKVIVKSLFPETTSETVTFRVSINKKIKRGKGKLDNFLW